jgi:bacterioferritin-associated ferredoxin
LADPDAVGDSGSMRSGPGVRIALRVRTVDGVVVIEDARFLTVALPAARPFASALCEVIIGATVADVSRISIPAVARLGGATTATQACRVVHFAKSAALTPFLGRSALAGNDITCVCFGIPTVEIRDVIRRHRLTTVSEVQEHLPAGSGCGTCRPEIQQLLDDDLQSF